jgi:glycosyltransferase involved in cell wall biosynthesis
MLFSIIIPVYNVEKYIHACLDSVRYQSFPNWEAICVDDGSTDRSHAILEEYAVKDNRIIIISQLNAGTAAARNTGLRSAKGEYIFFLDSDDWLEPDSLQILANRLRDEDILCFSGKRYFESTGDYHPADVLQEKVYEKGMDYYNENALLHRDFAFVCVVLRVYNRGFLMRNGLLFDDDISYEDNLWVPITLYYARTVTVIPDVLYIYRIREGSKMREVSLKRKTDMLKVANRLAAFFIPKMGFDKTVVYRAITHHFQRVLLGASNAERKELNRICEWNEYRKVSRTKIRHRVNYIKTRLKSFF